MKLRNLVAAGAFLFVAGAAFAQDTTTSYDGAAASSGGELRSPSPRIADPNRPGYIQLGVGPAFGLGMSTDNVMYDINAAYNYNLSDRLTTKAIGDFVLGTSSDTARMITFSGGLDYYLQEIEMSYGIPYVTGDVGFSFARDNNARTQDAVALGAGAGFKFAAESLNFDVNLHYTALTAQLDNKTPSVFGIRAAVAF